MRNEFKFIITLLVFFCIVLIIRLASMDRNEKIATGKITRLYRTTRGRDSWGISFKYNDKIYEAGCPCIGSGCEDYIFNKIVKDKEILILFDSTNPSNSLGITDKKVYKNYKVEYPLFLDSLSG
jgi:hypothetical protein